MDPSKSNGRIFDVRNIDEVADLGRKLGIEDLPGKIESFNPSEEGLADWLTAKRFEQNIYGVGDLERGSGDE